MTTTYESRGVLAGAYRDQSLKSCLTHVVELVDGRDVRVLCKGVKLDSMCDEDVTGRVEVTCKTCAKRDPRNKEK